MSTYESEQMRVSKRVGRCLRGLRSSSMEQTKSRHVCGGAQVRKGRSMNQVKVKKY